MQFTQIPEQGAPLGEELRYTVVHETAGNIDIRIFDASNNMLLGAKRFASVTTATFDIAPYLQRASRFVPTIGGTGFCSAPQRSVTTVVEAVATEDETIAAVAPARTFSPGTETTGISGLRTTMPLNRLIPAGVCEELTFLTGDICTVTVTAQAGDTTMAESYRSPKAGLQLFRLDLRDFPEAETLTVDAGVYGTVVYSVIPTGQGSVRLAWRSQVGSVEHYTFPVVQTDTIYSNKRQAEGPNGRIIVAAKTDRERLLVSAYESQPVLEALAELTASPDIWIVEGDTYIPTEVTTNEAVVRRHGTLCCLEIAIRPKKCTLWN